MGNLVPVLSQPLIWLALAVGISLGIGMANLLRSQKQ